MAITENKRRTKKIGFNDQFILLASDLSPSKSAYRHKLLQILMIIGRDDLVLANNRLKLTAALREIMRPRSLA